MNNNRGNNRRRGRGNRPNGGGGGQQLNRIDSRARGNAPQLLEKYRKLAQDAHLNGDRVQAEYYLQFADHYFRVIADTRLRQEEQRMRRDDRWEGGAEEVDESGEFSVESDFPNFDQPSFTRPQRAPRPQPEEREAREDETARDDDEGERGDASQANPYEPAENPFVRDNRARQGLRPRRDNREERRPRAPRGEGDDAPAAEPAGLDPASLPPAISTSRNRDEDEQGEAKPKRPRLRRKASGNDAGETLESMN